MRKISQASFVTTARPLLFICLAVTALILSAVGCSQSAPTDSGQTDSAQVDRGRALYAKECQACHGEAATGQGVLPNTPVHTPSGHTWHHHDDLLIDIVLGQFQYDGRQMPSFQDSLSEGDIIDILAYIKTGWQPDQREAQAKITSDWRNSQ